MGIANGEFPTMENSNLLELEDEVYNVQYAENYLQTRESIHRTPDDFALRYLGENGVLGQKAKNKMPAVQANKINQFELKLLNLEGILHDAIAQQLCQTIKTSIWAQHQCHKCNWAREVEIADEDDASSTKSGGTTVGSPVYE